MMRAALAFLQRAIQLDTRISAMAYWQMSVPYTIIGESALGSKERPEGLRVAGQG